MHWVCSPNLAPTALVATFRRALGRVRSRVGNSSVGVVSQLLFARDVLTGRTFLRLADYFRAMPALSAR